MTVEEIRGACAKTRMDDVEARIRASMIPVDEAFIHHIFMYYLNHTLEVSPVKYLENAMESEDFLDEAVKRSRGEAWYNTYPFGKKTDKVYSEFLGISLGKSKLNDVLKHAVKHNDDVAKYCEPSNFRDRTTVILTDRWDPDVFRKYEKELLRQALLYDIWTVFILVTDYGFEQVPFLPNDRNATDGLVLDEDAVRVDIQKWMDEPVVYSVYGGTWNRNHHDEYTIYLYDKVWELISEEEGRHRGKIRYKAINKFLDEVIWIAETDSLDLESYIRGYDSGSYELRIFGKRLIWDATTIGENGDPRYIKLNKSLKKLLKAFEPEEDD